MTYLTVAGIASSTASLALPGLDPGIAGRGQHARKSSLLDLRILECRSWASPRSVRKSDLGSVRGRFQKLRLAAAPLIPTFSIARRRASGRLRPSSRALA